VRRTLIALVLALAVLGAGCSSQPSAVAVAQKQVRVWEATVRADAKAETAGCLPGAGCPVGALTVKTCLAEQVLFQAEEALYRAEGKTFPSGFPTCRAYQH
jgi:hypothetical protein